MSRSLEAETEKRLPWSKENCTFPEAYLLLSRHPMPLDTVKTSAIRE